ncbi:MAG: hypothetical protein LBC77_07070 [Spirochaetaceae bacterium]|jgi:hypothetical protein|nr:hypothetical protein [Spirochaetaceae bacterium]
MILAKRLFAAMFFARLAGALFAEDPFLLHTEPFTVVSSRERAFGGPHTTMGGGIFLLFSNPASLAYIQQNTLLGMELTLEDVDRLSELIDIANVMPYTKAYLQSRAELGLSVMPPSFKLAGPLIIGVAGKSMAIGFFSRFYTSSTFTFSEIIPIPIAPVEYDLAVHRVNINSDFIVSGGISWNIKNTPSYNLDLGIAAKLCYRGAEELLSQQTAIAHEADRVVLETGDISSRNILGLSLDSGLLFSYMDRLLIGLTLNDAPAPLIVMNSGEFESLPAFCMALPHVNLGIAVNIFYTQPVVCTLAVDFRDALAVFGLTGTPRNALLNLSAGLEVTVYHLVKLRAGFADLLPSGGIGMDLGAVSINFALYGAEYGINPGDMSVLCGSVGFIMFLK